MEPTQEYRVDRRSVFRMAGVAGLGLAAAACGGPAGTSSKGGKVRLPAYQPYRSLPKPALPPSAAGLQAGYLTYPERLVASVAKPPGSGGDVTALMEVTGSLPPPVGKNPTWQAVNEALNANVRFQMIPSSDYVQKVGTVLSGKLPDLLFLTRNITVQKLPQFLDSSTADLSPYLSGDAIKDYPNLAAFPTTAWQFVASAAPHALHGVPLVRPAVDYAWFINQTELDAVGGSTPENADEFKDMLRELTRPREGKYGLGMPSPSFGLVSRDGAGDTPQTAMFGAPNNWSVSSSGRFTKDFETEEFAAALHYVRDLYKSGVYHPDATLSLDSLRAYLLAGKLAVTVTGWAAYAPLLWDVGALSKPPIKIRNLHPFSHDGGEPSFHRFSGVNGYVVMKKAEPKRLKELLGILDYIAAPFGTEEYELMLYGRKGSDFTLDGSGNPVRTEEGSANSSVPWQRICTSVAVLYDPAYPEFTKTAYADLKATVPHMVDDPSLGLYSATQASKGTQLSQRFAEAIGEIVAGRRPTSALKQALDDWRSGGGDQIRKEYEKAHRGKS